MTVLSDGDGATSSAVPQPSTLLLEVIRQRPGLAERVGWVQRRLALAAASTERCGPIRQRSAWLGLVGGEVVPLAAGMNGVPSLDALTGFMSKDPVNLRVESTSSGE